MDKINKNIIADEIQDNMAKYLCISIEGVDFILSCALTRILFNESLTIKETIFIAIIGLIINIIFFIKYFKKREEYKIETGIETMGFDIKYKDLYHGLIGMSAFVIGFLFTKGIFLFKFKSFGKVLLVLSIICFFRAVRAHIRYKLKLKNNCSTV